MIVSPPSREKRFWLGGRSRRVGVERIDVRLRVADGAVGIDEVMNRRLLQRVGAQARGRGGAEALAVGGQRETLEKRAPGRIDGLGIVEPALIILLDHDGVGLGGQIEFVHKGRGIGHGWETVRKKPTAA